MASFNYAGRGHVASLSDRQEMGNLLNKLTHALSEVLYWTQMYTKKFRINIPPPTRGMYERFFGTQEAQAKHNKRLE